MLPKKELNIYPKSDENLNALLSFYVDKKLINTGSAIKELQSLPLSLNQVEFIIQQIYLAYEIVFKPSLNGPQELTNLITYAMDALTIEESNWKGSSNRNSITKRFKDFVKEKSNINSLGN